MLGRDSVISHSRSSNKEKQGKEKAKEEAEKKAEELNQYITSFGFLARVKVISGSRLTFELK